MKSYLKILTISLTLIVSVVMFPKQGKAQQENVNFQIFYDQLSPYGQWVNNPSYGYVWIPDVGEDFAPYSTAGHWVFTDYGWTWMSDYEWGWAPFHYGRWNFDNSYGWFWVPDNQWGPAWVTWRSADGYYGWAPMESGLSISLSFGRSYNRDNDHWTFVRDRDIERPDISLYYTNQNDRNRIILNSSIISHTYIDNSRNVTYVSGPSREDVQRVTGRTMKSVAIQENDRPGQTMINGQLRIFRPQLDRNNNNNQRSAPSRIIDIKDIKRPSERGQANQPRNANPGDQNRTIQQPDNVIEQDLNRSNMPKNVIPSGNDGRQQQPANVIPQNKNQRPDFSQNQIPSGNDRRLEQPSNGVQQNNYNRSNVPQNQVPISNNREQLPTSATPQNIPDPKPVVPQNTIPSVNDRRQSSQRANTPESNNNLRPSVPKNATPAVIDRRQQQPVTVNPQNKNVKSTQPQTAQPTGNNRGQQTKTVRTVNNKRNQQNIKPVPETQK